jgi:hypothetical protein
MTEAGMWKRIRVWGRGVYQLHLARIENSVGVGQPDVNFGLEGREGWMELKVWPRKLKPSQVIWIEDRVAAGCMPMVMVYLRGEYFLLRAVDYFEPTILSVQRDAVWRESDRGWEWLSDALYKVIASGA